MYISGDLPGLETEEHFVGRVFVVQDVVRRLEKIETPAHADGGNQRGVFPNYLKVPKQDFQVKKRFDGVWLYNGWNLQRMDFMTDGFYDVWIL